MKRRTLLQSAGLGTLLASCGKRSHDLPIKWLGQDPLLGHKIRDGLPLPAPSKTLKVEVAIVGAGIAGLSAAWWLAREGKTSLALLDMQDTPGGNARSGKNQYSAFPLGAHYLPAPGPQAHYVRQLLADLQVIKGDPFQARPVYDPKMLCFAPQERLWHENVWQEGLLPFADPATNQGKIAQAEYEKFHSLINRWIKTGSFAVPQDLAKLSPEALALDRLTFTDYLSQEGFSHPWLFWYTDYCCRDDYGTSASETSAFFGIHYFASRHSVAVGEKSEFDPVLTWPEGNGWLSTQLAALISKHQENALHQRMLTLRVEDRGTEVIIDALNLNDQSSLQVRAKKLILAVPVFTLGHLINNCPTVWRKAAALVEYAPWLVANLALKKTPHSLDNTQPAWDNVIYGSTSLGYVNATHQSLAARSTGATTWTWYYTPAHLPAAQARKQLLDFSARHWVDTIVAELLPIHPNIAELLEQVDLTRYGHAMARPLRGTLSHSHRKALRIPIGRIMLAHSDLAGYSVFEEANYFGVQAAQWAASR